MDFLRIMVLFSLLYWTTAHSVTEPTFSKTKIAVEFNPPNLDDEPKIVNDFMPPIKKIATTFRKLTMPIDPESPSLSEGLSAVATYNVEYLKKGDSPLEASILFEVIELLNKTSGPPFGWNNAVEAANNANKIYGGSIKRILLYHNDLKLLQDMEDSMYVQEFEMYVAKAKFPNNSDIELGAILPIRFCSPDSLPLLENIHHIVFEWLPFVKDGKPYFLDVNPHSAIQRLSQEFAECKKIIQKYVDNITIGIQTGWVSHRNSLLAAADDENLTVYWQLINDFAVNFNVEVILVAAFDINDYAYFGWWKVVKDNGSNEYIFEDKIQISPTQQYTFSSYWAYVPLIVTLIGFVGVILIAIFLRKFFPNIFHIQYNRNMPFFNCFKL